MSDQVSTEITSEQDLDLFHEHFQVTEWEGREDHKPSLPSILQIYAALISPVVTVFEGREATADGLNPLTISHTAKTISCKKMGNARGM